MKEHNLSVWKRFWIYQKERFPIFAHGLLIFMFTFSAIAYSRICRQQEGFIDWSDFMAGFITTFCLFLLLRILDEFKDADIDAKYRKELPVPRGLVKLTELKILGFLVAAIQVVVILIFHPSMIVFYIIVMVWLALMTVEFFAHDWLNNHMFFYVASHMVIIPLVDIYASGLDWYLSDVPPHLGLLFFFGVSYFNGIVLEIGRKLKAPSKEKEGVVTYSGMHGYHKGANLWMFFLFVTGVIASGACYYAGLSPISYLVLGVIFLVCIVFAQRYKNDPESKASKHIEILSGLWTLLMYGVLGGIPGLIFILR